MTVELQSFTLQSLRSRMVGREGFEPSANGLKGHCSTGLSYRPDTSSIIAHRTSNVNHGMMKR